MIRHSRYYEDKTDDFISSLQKTIRQKGDITKILDKYLNIFKNGIELSNGSITFKGDFRYYSPTIYIDGKKIYMKDVWVDSLATSEEERREFLSTSPDTLAESFINEVRRELTSGNQFSKANPESVETFLEELEDRKSELADLFETYTKYCKYYDKYDLARGSRRISNNSLSTQAIQDDVFNKAPKISEMAYALWKSKNGIRKVTVLSVDEPNHRAKINTDKGAIMYVPLDTLLKNTTETWEEFCQRLKDAGVWDESYIYGPDYTGKFYGAKSESNRLKVYNRILEDTEF